MITTATMIGILIGLACYFYQAGATANPDENCNNDNSIIRDFAGLEKDLTQKLHGQHLVKDLVLANIRSHFTNDKPRRALVLSFHGQPGVGKNFVSDMIASNMYLGGRNSPYVHFISATNAFPHKDRVWDYKEQLKSWIEEDVKKCERAMFIFDEVDTIPPFLLDVLKPFVDYNSNLGGVDYRKTVFILLSNYGGERIQEYMLKLRRRGRKRGDVTFKDLETKILANVLHAQGQGLRHSVLISHHLIQAYIPFLPMEKSHVKMCIKDELQNRGDFENEEIQMITAEVLKELNFYPSEEKYFSVTGCKRIAEKIDYVFETMKDREKKKEKEEQEEDLEEEEMRDEL